MPDLESKAIDLLNFNHKLLLTGSTSLNWMGVMPRKPVDLDFSLTEPLTEGELEHLIDFFHLSTKRMNQRRIEYDIHNNPINEKWEPATISDMISKDLILLSYDETSTDGEHVFSLKIDIFNKDIIKSRDIITIRYNGYNVRIVHPSLTIAAKAKYAFDPRVSSKYKHQDDLKDLLLNRKIYFDTLR